MSNGVSILLNDYKYIFTISGNSTINVGSVDNIYVSSSGNGSWEISNYDSTQASIPPDSDNDTVFVSAGNKLGHFVLYFIAHYDGFRDTLIAKHVYVDNPTPVEMTSFTSSISGRDVKLNWTTLSELNNSGFEIERSIVKGQTSNEWTKVGFVSGSLTSTDIHNYEFTEKGLNTGKYKFRLKQIDFNGNFEYFELAEEVNIGTPDKYELSQNYPNPFNPVTNLEFGIPEFGFVSLKIYDVIGRELVTLVNEIKEPGYYKIRFNAADLSSGVYFYKMTSGDFVAVKKFVVLK
ncbi:MAG TPA: T9SS type A sorting domain-containing protein [Ignavibacteria bacterium]|nr:T9SS type A sorting domain-containing protein [Ignavibacteria bacterium]